MLRTLELCLHKNADSGFCFLPALKSALKKFSCTVSYASGQHQEHAPVVDVENASVYVHWPYCRRRCTYCNFNKYISDNVNHEQMKRCLQKEAVSLLRKSSVKEITSVFFGGGTPSLAEPKTLGAVVETIASEARLASGAEISMEINPTSIETSKMSDFQAAGINRASIGIQTLNDNALKLLGRDHSSDDSLRCLEAASQIYSRQTSVDLMFGYPGQTLEMWREELRRMLLVCDNHISLYQLTLERGTQLFKDVKRGLITLPCADEMADMYSAATEMLSTHGFDQYEVSNFAKEESYCQHNIGYWIGQQYIGVGPGSHGRFWKQVNGESGRHACIQTLEPENWMKEVERFGHATRKSTQQTSREILEELVSVSLRTKWGFLEKNWSALLPSISLQELLSFPRIDHWIKTGFLIRSQDGLQATSQGLMVLDGILPDILLDIDGLLTSSCQKHNT